MLRIEAAAFDERISLHFLVKTVNSNVSGQMMDIAIVQINARIERMSKRRQKIAVLKRPTQTFTNVYPISVGDIKESICGGRVEFEVKFSFDLQQ